MPKYKVIVEVVTTYVFRNVEADSLDAVRYKMDSWDEHDADDSFVDRYYPEASLEEEQ